MRLVLFPLLGLLLASLGCSPPPPPSGHGAPVPPATAPVGAKSRAEATRTDTVVIPLAGTAALSAALDNGFIRLTTDPSATEIRLEATISLRAPTEELAEQYLASVSVPLKQNDTMATVTPKIPAEWRNPNFANRPGSLEVNFTITGPPGLDYLLNSTNGDVTVTGEIPTLEAVANGAIDGGSGIRTRAKLSSTNGAIRATIAGAQDVDLNGTNGGITLDLIPGMAPLTGRWSLSTANGSLTAALPEISSGSAHLNSGNGAVVLTVPGTSTAACELDTTNGALDLKGQALTNITKQSGTTLRGRIGEARGLLRVSTINGAIELTVM